MIVPFLKPPVTVIAYLQNPRERFWGLVRHLDGTGVVIQGVELNSFDDWVRGVAQGGSGPQASTVFYPLIRVEKLLVDTRGGQIPSLSEQFERRVGRPVAEVLRIEG
ncbi:MAG: hypothetical protein ACE5JH_10045 [Acidobacteriota bacterium]